MCASLANDLGLLAETVENAHKHFLLLYPAQQISRTDFKNNSWDKFGNHGFSAEALEEMFNIFDLDNDGVLGIVTFNVNDFSKLQKEWSK